MLINEYLTPKRIVEELDKYIIGQDQAKRCVAIALRNRWRRQQISGDIKGEIMPNNIILIGPTGIGKTEIARRISSLLIVSVLGTPEEEFRPTTTKFP